MQPGARFTLPAHAEGLNRSLFFFKGANAKVGDQDLMVNFGLNLKSDAELEITNGDEEAEFLMLQGRPINEPVVQHGPFVMNYPAEIQETFLDYQRTEFGGWPWPRHDFVHPSQQRKICQICGRKSGGKSRIIILT